MRRRPGSRRGRGACVAARSRRRSGRRRSPTRRAAIRARRAMSPQAPRGAPSRPASRPSAARGEEGSPSARPREPSGRAGPRQEGEQGPHLKDDTAVSILSNQLFYGGGVRQAAEPRWWMLIHQIPPKPSYLRVKVWRRLQRLGAVAVKNSVYVLPRSEQAQEDFQWVAREIVEGGGDVSICEARFMEGLSDEQVEAIFHAARDVDYAQVAEAARRLLKGIGSGSRIGAENRASGEAEITRLKRRTAEVSSVDFLGAPGRRADRKST